MALPFHNTIRFNDMVDQDDIFTFALNAAIVVTDIGKAVTMDSTAGTVKLTGLGDQVIGRLESFDSRQGNLVGAVATGGVMTFPTTAAVIPIGSKLEGSATPGVVVAAAAPDFRTNYVVTVNTTALTAVAVIK